MSKFESIIHHLPNLDESSPEYYSLCEELLADILEKGQWNLSSKFEQWQVDALIENIGPDYHGAKTGAASNGDFFDYDWSASSGRNVPIAHAAFGFEIGAREAGCNVFFFHEDSQTVTEDGFLYFSLKIFQKRRDRGHHTPIWFDFSLPHDEAQRFIEAVQIRPSIAFNVFWLRYQHFFGQGGTTLLCPTSMIAIFPNASDSLRRKPFSHNRNEEKKRSAELQFVLENLKVDLAAAIQDRDNFLSDTFLQLVSFTYSEESAFATSDQRRYVRKVIAERNQLQISKIEENMRIIQQKIDAQIVNRLKRALRLG